jgi:hypothetical protein
MNYYLAVYNQSNSIINKLFLCFSKAMSRQNAIGTKNDFKKSIKFQNRGWWYNISSVSAKKKKMETIRIYEFAFYKTYNYFDV